jgi:hypothetical protein
MVTQQMMKGYQNSSIGVTDWRFQGTDWYEQFAHGVGIVELVFLGPAVACLYLGLPVHPIHPDGL